MKASGPKADLAITETIQYLDRIGYKVGYTQTTTQHLIDSFAARRSQ